MKKYLLFLLLIVMSNAIKAQSLINTGKLIQGGLEDGTKLVDAYVTPVNKAIVYGLSDVTYTKLKKEAKHRLLVSVKLANVNIPQKDLSFDVTRIGLQNLEPKDPNNIMAQTVFGDSLRTVTLVSKDKDIFGRPLIEFNTPTGSARSAMPLPFLGLTYRLKHTNISAQIIPYVPIPDSDMSIGMLGGSVQQDLAMFIQSLQDKAFGASVQAGGAFLYGHSDLNIKPGGITTPVSITGSSTGPYNNQEINIYYTSFNLGAYIDYTIAEKFTFFAGTGLNFGTSHIAVTGTYPVYVSDPTGLGSVVVDDVDDPLVINSSFSRIKFDIGLRADFNRFFVQVNYNIATYGGLGLNLGYKML